LNPEDEMLCSSTITRTCFYWRLLLALICSKTCVGQWYSTLVLN